ncbi:MAG TPA: hypothetical protein VNX68_00805, partial [Nitrosopumilaceae archaeon]|nr:hypothetical protein [Nitrosopumilaceae archaeon]
RLRAINNLLDSKKITYIKYIAGLYAARAAVYEEKYDKEFEIEYKLLEDTMENFYIKSVLRDYKISIDTCVFCEPLHRLGRKEFLESSAVNDSMFLDDRSYLKKHGFKEEREGLVVGINYFKGKSDWAGIEVAGSGILMPRYVLRNIDPVDGKKKKVDDQPIPFAGNAFTLGFNQNLNQRAHEFTFSLLQITSPFIINIAKFGLIQSPLTPKGSWFYRPEVGIGWGWISAGYSYNFVFSKSDRNQFEKHLFIVKLNYPIINYWR